MKGLVQEANFDCSSTGISLQAMDTSHVSLIALQLREDGFEKFRCDRNMSLGISLESMTKVLKCSSSEDVISLKVTLRHVFVATCKGFACCISYEL